MALITKEGQRSFSVKTVPNMAQQIDYSKMPEYYLLGNGTYVEITKEEHELMSKGLPCPTFEGRFHQSFPLPYIEN